MNGSHITGALAWKPPQGTKLYHLVTEAHWCEQLAQSRWLTMHQPGIEPETFQTQVQCPNHYTTKPPWTISSTYHTQFSEQKNEVDRLCEETVSKHNKWTPATSCMHCRRTLVVWSAKNQSPIQCLTMSNITELSCCWAATTTTTCTTFSLCLTYYFFPLFLQIRPYFKTKLQWTVLEGVFTGWAPGRAPNQHCKNTEVSSFNSNWKSKNKLTNTAMIITQSPALSW